MWNHIKSFTFHLLKQEIITKAYQFLGYLVACRVLIFSRGLLIYYQYFWPKHVTTQILQCLNYIISTLESQSDVVDVRFDDLHHARYASCATDIHNLLYYTVDADIQRDHTVNLLAVYHDHFSKVDPIYALLYTDLEFVYPRKPK